VAQSILWIYAPGREPHVESDPLNTTATGITAVTVQGVMALEKAVLEAAPLERVVLRYGVFYGPGTRNDSPAEPAAVHVNAAARAALLAVDRGEGVYNVAEPSPYASSDRARRDLGWDPTSRG
jgi:nucleoside-diphosphate-sugar epimerase